MRGGSGVYTYANKNIYLNKAYFLFNLSFKFHYLAVGFSCLDEVKAYYYTL